MFRSFFSIPSTLSVSLLMMALVIPLSGWGVSPKKPPATPAADKSVLVQVKKPLAAPVLPKGQGCPWFGQDEMDLDAQDEWADTLIDSQGPRPDLDKAIACYRTTAYAGSTYARFMMGIFYLKGIGVSADPHLSDRYYRAAQTASLSEQAEAELEVAERFLDRRTGIYDPREAESWLVRAADAGLLEAQDRLGEYYEMGEGGLSDTLKAVNAYSKAALRGFPSAQYHLGHLLLKGSEALGVNPTESISWIKKAAMQGYPAAQIDLAALYADGAHVPQSWTEAYAWWQLGKSHITAPYLEQRITEEMKHWDANKLREAIHKANDYRYRYLVG